MLLRAFRPEDTIPFHRILAGRDVLRYFPRSTPPGVERVREMIEATGRHWREHGFGLWAVEDASGDLLGRAGLQIIPDTGEVEIDFLLGRPWWGKGFATEAARSCLLFGLEEKGLERIVGIVHPENAASRAVLEKIGMQGEGEKEYFGMRCLRYAVSRQERQDSHG